MCTCFGLLADTVHQKPAGNSPEMGHCSLGEGLVEEQRNTVVLGILGKYPGMQAAVRKDHFDCQSIAHQIVDGHSRVLGFLDRHADWGLTSAQKRALADTHHNHNSAAWMNRHQRMEH